MRATRPRQLAAITVISIGLASCGGDDSPTAPTPPVCSIGIAPADGAFDSDGGSASITVTAAAGCSWTATTNADWISITSGATGNGPGSVSYSVAINSNTQARTGVVAIGGQNHALTQRGRPPGICGYEIAPDNATFGSDGGARTFAVTAPGECSWTAVADAPWVTVTSGSQGTGNGSVSYTVAANAGVTDRVTQIAVMDRRFTVRQAGDVAACRYSVSPIEFSPCMPGGTVTATLTTQASCPWTAVPDAPWLTVSGGASGAGSSVITVAYSENYDAPRLGIVMIRWPTPTAGQNVRVAQAGCVYAVSRAAFSYTAVGGSGTFDVIQQSDPYICGGATQDRCVWTAQSNVPWITITSSMPRAGDNPVAFVVAPNDGSSARVGNITVRDKVVAIAQAGR